MKTKQNLVDRVIEVIKSDINSGDVTALDGLLLNTDVSSLVRYLPEEEWKNYNVILQEKFKRDSIEDARHILCENMDLDVSSIEENILFQINAIQEFSKENPDKYIDWVPGVVVWGMVANTYTCEEFLEHIGW